MFKNINILDTHSKIIYSENPYTLFIDNHNYYFSTIKIDNKYINNKLLVKTKNNINTIKSFENYIYSETFLNGNIYISNSRSKYNKIIIDGDHNGPSLIKYNILSSLDNTLDIGNDIGDDIYYKKMKNPKITVLNSKININDNAKELSYGDTYHITDANNGNIIVVTSLINSPSPAPTPSPVDASNGGFAPTPSPADASNGGFIQLNDMTNITINQTKTVKLEDIFSTSNAIYTSKIKQYYNLSDPLVIPHWEYDSDKGDLIYYGSLAKCSGDINITLSQDTILPFGLSNAIFKIKIDDICNVNDDLRSKLSKLNTPEGSCMRVKYSDFSDYNLKDWQLSTDNAIENSLADYINTQTRKNSKKRLNSFKISGGGVLSGRGIRMKPFFKDDGEPNWMHVYQWDDSGLGYKRANFINPNDHDNNIWYQIKNGKRVYHLGDFLNSVEHWILGGLLEVWATTIEVNNISIIQGFCRGRAPTQLNGKNIYPDIYPRLEMVHDLSNTKVIVKNTQIVLHDVGQMDGYDSYSYNIMENIYFNCQDDNLKLNSDISASDITFQNGDSGGAICYGGYNNNIPLKDTTINNIYIHGFGTHQAEVCPNNEEGKQGYTSWPGPALLYAPWVPMINNKEEKVNSIEKVTLNNIYILPEWDNTDYAFFVGGYLMNTFSCMAIYPPYCDPDSCNYKVDPNPKKSIWTINVNPNIPLDSSKFVNNCVNTSNLIIKINGEKQNIEPCYNKNQKFSTPCSLT